MVFWSRAGKLNDEAKGNLPKCDARAAHLFSDKGEGVSRQIDLYLSEAGSMKVEGSDVGQKVKHLLGDSDYEFGVSLNSQNVAALCFALLRDKLSDKADAVDVLREYCKAEGIECEFWNWV